MITITEQPPSIASILTEPKAPPVPVSECWRWCLQPDAIDAIDTPGSNALVTVTFPAVPTIPADGTTFRIWGYDFTIDSGQAYTSTSFEVTAVGLFTALNFLKMIQSNFFFNRAVQLGFAVVGFDYQVTIILNDCRIFGIARSYRPPLWTVLSGGLRAARFCLSGSLHQPRSL